MTPASISRRATSGASVWWQPAITAWMGVPETRPATSSPDRARMNARMTGRSRDPVPFASDRPMRSASVPQSLPMASCRAPAATSASMAAGWRAAQATVRGVSPGSAPPSTGSPFDSRSWMMSTSPPPRPRRGAPSVCRRTPPADSRPPTAGPATVARWPKAAARIRAVSPRFGSPPSIGAPLDRARGDARDVAGTSGLQQAFQARRTSCPVPAPAPATPAVRATTPSPRRPAGE
ncbi:MAG: hypothetical protein MZU79_06480 [Anaerotruncus sp.]|nr:hypothetical protein [Anaerotruncus sp.]